MKYFIICLAALLGLAGCASIKVADNVKMIAFKDKAPKEVKSLGNVDGKDCTWYVAGYPLGTAPTVRSAFANTSSQREEGLPLQMRKKDGVADGGLSYLRNVSVDPSGFSAWVVGRSCINVTGVGFQ